ncbi:MAG: hypothetical protein WA964_10545 [Ilumatobacter sp.]|uniref:hypothetical protein n=1 Tax=Ilumatobacter sp. TaxID=1967498 RepID=UPI003C7632C9
MTTAAVHDGEMDPAAETREAAELAKSAAWSSISWETPSAQRVHSSAHFDHDRFRDHDRRGVGAARWTDLHSDVTGAPVPGDGMRRHVHHWCAFLSRPTFGQVHGGSPMETTRIAGASVSEAADVLARTTEIEWGRGRNVGDLRLGPFRSHPTELGQPWVADAVVHGHRIRRFRVTVAIFRYGDDRCGIQVRPKFRRPRTSRRLRQCLRSTHAAADRLRDLVLTVDFMPPLHSPGVFVSA